MRHNVATAAVHRRYSPTSRTCEGWKTVMILASCAYMLSDVIQGLRAMGWPTTTYRLQQGAWNPLRGATAALASFLRFDKAVWGDAALPTWTEADLNRWVKYVKSTAGLKRGAKEKLKRGEGLGIVDVFDADASFFMAFASNRERLDWYLENLTAEGKRRMEFPMKLYRRDPKQIAEKPKVIVGTIHSVKGGEADSVYVFPDMSRSQVQTWYSSPKGMDSLRRVYYVAGTRAREKLTLCRASHGVFGFPLTEGCI